MEQSFIQRTEGEHGKLRQVNLLETLRVFFLQIPAMDGLDVNMDFPFIFQNTSIGYPGGPEGIFILINKKTDGICSPLPLRGPPVKGLRGKGQGNGNRGAEILLALYIHLSPMVFNDDLLTKSQSQTGSPRFGREERVE